MSLLHALFGVYYGLAVAPIAGPAASLLIVQLSLRGFNTKGE
jgi:hypothetical protein